MGFGWRRGFIVFMVVVVFGKKENLIIMEMRIAWIFIVMVGMMINVIERIFLFARSFRFFV